MVTQPKFSTINASIHIPNVDDKKRVTLGPETSSGSVAYRRHAYVVGHRVGQAQLDAPVSVAIATRGVIPRGQAPHTPAVEVHKTDQSGDWSLSPPGARPWTAAPPGGWRLEAGGSLPRIGRFCGFGLATRLFFLLDGVLARLARRVEIGAFVTIGRACGLLA